MIEIRNLSKTFDSVEALKNVSITIEDGDIFGIIGMSGAGKSTLVRTINMLEKPTDGTVLIDGVDLSLLSKKELREVRRNVTMIFQHFNLLQQRTCLKNVCFPLELIGVKKDEAEKKAMELLTLVGLPDKADSYPSQLSGGQQQRVAIARALATNPKVLLCDEATSALDPKTTAQILELIRKINKELNITVVVITHQMSVVEDVCNKVAILDQGEVKEQGLVTDIFSSPKSAAAKRLVFPDGASSIERGENEHRIRLIFNGSDTTNTPMIAKLAMECGIAANIIAANTKVIEGDTYGYMVLGITGTHETLGRAVDFIKSTGKIEVMEVPDDVQ
ncbi:MAG: ATP-binding cassette domain-containing protein [Clostridia bacterium]|nr:ATP-binding cassette domain-containing protein [Clostridia bacterium]